MHRRLRPLLLLSCTLALPLLATCARELPGPKVCSSQRSCGKGQACVLGRCRKSTRAPVSAKASRMHVPAQRWVKLSAEGSQDSRGTAATLTLGDPAEGPSLLLLRFAVTLPAERSLERALLVVDPMPDCARLPGRVRLELAQVRSPWHAGAVSWSRRPELDMPMRAGTVPATPHRPLRLDVTELVRRWGEHRGRYHGLALLAEGDGPGPACFTTGATWGQGPRLEVYLAPVNAKKDAGADADAGDEEADGGGGHGGGADDEEDQE